MHEIPYTLGNIEPFMEIEKRLSEKDHKNTEIIYFDFAGLKQLLLAIPEKK